MTAIAYGGGGGVLAVQPLLERQELRLELVLGDAGADDLVLHFAVLEEEQEGDRADAVFDGELAGVVDIDLADLGAAGDVGGELIDDGSDHFAGAAPFGPEVDEDRHVGVNDFGLEIGFGEFE